MIDLPKATYPLCDSISKSIISSGALSSLQLEGILYAVSFNYYPPLLPSTTSLPTSLPTTLPYYPPY